MCASVLSVRVAVPGRAWARARSAPLVLVNFPIPMSRGAVLTTAAAALPELGAAFILFQRFLAGAGFSALAELGAGFILFLELTGTGFRALAELSACCAHALSASS